MLAEAQSSGRQPLVLDVRNSYEWDAGHFEGAQRPLEVRCPGRRCCMRPICAALHCTALHCTALEARRYCSAWTTGARFAILHTVRTAPGVY